MMIELPLAEAVTGRERGRLVLAGVEVPADARHDGLLVQPRRPVDVVALDAAAAAANGVFAEPACRSSARARSSG